MNIFIVGSSRSGTTLLSDTLARHSEVTSWNEPSFVLDHFHRDLVDDCRNAHHASSEVITYLRKKFDYLRRKRLIEQAKCERAEQYPRALRHFNAGRKHAARLTGDRYRPRWHPATRG